MNRIDVSNTERFIQDPRIQWRNIKNINKVAPKTCNKRMNQPTLTSTMRYTTESKAMV